MADDSSSSSNSTAVVAIVVLVLIALGAVFYFVNRGGGTDSLVPDKVEVEIDKGGSNQGSGTGQ